MKGAVRWCVLFLLVGIGVASSINRGIAITNGVLFFDPIRDRLEPSVKKDLEIYDREFVAHRALTLLHIISGSTFLILAPFQFSSTLRARHIRFHRWSGRLLLLAGFITGFTGLLLAAFFLFTGATASSAVVIFGSIFLFALIKAFIAIRRQDIASHREWMIRAFAVGIGISVVRMVGGLLFVITPSPTFKLLGISFWIGWVLTFATAELWIRRLKLKDGARIADPRPI